MRGILIIAELTFHEARRKRVMLAALLLGIAFLLIFALGFYFIQSETRSMPRDVTGSQREIILTFVAMAGLYAANFLIVMMAALLPVDTLAGEIRSGAIQSLVTKPLSRASVVLGKWLGFWFILALYLALLAGGILLIVRVVGGLDVHGAAIGLPLMLLEGTLLLSLSIAGGTRLSTLANGVMVFGLYGLAFIGGWMEQVGVLLGNTTAQNVGIIASLIVPSESLWQLAAYHMQPAVMRDLALTPFSPASVPSPAMVVWAAGYTIVVVLLAVWSFKRRDL